MTDAHKLVEMFSKLFNVRKAKNCKLTLRLNITDPIPETFQLLVENDSCIIDHNPASLRSADVELTLDGDTFSKISGGNFSMKDAIKMKLVEQSGSIFSAMKIPSIFSGNPDKYKYSLPEKKWEKPKKVIIINGSPRNKDNSATWYYESIFTKAFYNEKDIAVDYLSLADLSNLVPCKGCFYCQTKKLADCCIKDDLTPFLDDLPGYDLVILTTPIYNGYCTSLTKILIDREFRFLDLAIKDVGYGYPRPTIFYEKMPYTFIFSVSGLITRDVFIPLINSLKDIIHFNFLDSLFIPGAFAYYQTLIQMKQNSIIKQLLPSAADQLIKYGRIDNVIKSKIENPKYNKYKLINGNNYTLTLERSQGHETSSRFG